MTTKIRYNVHTSNKYSVFDSEASEDEIGIKNKVKTKHSKELNRGKSNEEKKSNMMNSNDITNATGIKGANPMLKPTVEKKIITPLNDRDKHIIPSLNDMVNERAYRNYRENVLNKKNEKKKTSRFIVGGGSIGTVSTNGVAANSVSKGARNHDNKLGVDRRPYNSSYRHEKYDYKERTVDYDDTSPKYDKFKKGEGHDYRNKGSYYEGVRKTRKQESITIDFDMYRRQQEKKMNSNNKNSDVNESRKKEENTEKGERINSNTRRGETEEEHKEKSEHPKKKVLNMYQFISEERRKTERVPGFYKSYRGYRRGGVGYGMGEDRYRSYNNKSKITIDENILKNRDPPNIYDTRAFPSLTTSK